MQQKEIVTELPSCDVSSPFPHTLFNDCIFYPLDDSMVLKHYNQYQEDNQMSFIGMAICKEGIVAFGDTRSSLIDALGNKSLEADRKTRKIFQGRNFLLATCGTNRFYRNIIDLICIEDYIEEQISFVEDYQQFLFDMNEYLSQGRNTKGQYDFIIGGKDKKGWFLQSCQFQKGQMTVLPKQRCAYLSKGHEYYCEKFGLSEIYSFAKAIQKIRVFF